MTTYKEQVQMNMRALEIEYQDFREVLRNCTQEPYLEEVLHTQSAEINKILIEYKQRLMQTTNLLVEETNEVYRCHFPTAE